VRAISRVSLIDDQTLREGRRLSTASSLLGGIQRGRGRNLHFGAAFFSDIIGSDGAVT